MPYPLPLTRTEAYLAYKAGVIQQSDLKPSLAVPRNGIDAWLAYWTGLTPTYPVKNVGKNLFNVATAIDNHWLNYQTGELINDSNPNVVSNFIEVTSGTTYTISGADDLRIDVWQYTAPDEKTGTARIVLLANQPHTFTPNTPWIRFAVGSGDAISVKNQFMLEAGSTATSFEPYTGEPLTLQEEEAYIAYLSGAANEYPEKCLRRVGAYLRYLISARWGRPDHPLNREELYLSLLKTQVIPSGDPSSDIEIDGTAKAAFQDVKMYGDTFQQSYTGKNIFTTGNFDYTNGGIRSIGSNGVISLSGTLNLTWGFNIYGGHNLIPSGIIPAGTYTVSITKSVVFPFILGLVAEDNTTTLGNFTIPAGSTSYTFTTDQPAKYFTLWSNYANHSGEQISVTDLSIMIESGSSATSFEPYVGGTSSPNPDYPQPIQTVTGRQTVTVTGKNLVGATEQSYTNQGITTTLNSDGTITCKGTCSQAYFQITRQTAGGGIAEATPCNIPAGTYTISLTNATDQFGVTLRLYASTTSTDYIQVVITKGDSSNTITLTSPAVMFYIWGSSTTVGQEIDETIGIQFEQGSTATSFAPFSKQAYEINLGKNLFNKNDAVNGIPSASDGSIVSTSSVGRTSDYIPVVPNTDYSHTGHPLGWATVAWYKADKSFIRREDNVTTIASPSEAAYARVSCAQDNLGTCQFEAGEPTNYAPYFTPIELCKLGTYQDYIWKDGEDWKVHKEVGKSNLKTDCTDWQVLNTNLTAEKRYGVLVKQTDIPSTDPATVTKPLFANTLGMVSRVDTYNRVQGISTSPYNQRLEQSFCMYIQSISDSSTATVDAIKSWLQNNETVVYYQSTSPTDTIITNTNLIAQLDALVNGGAEDGTTYIKVNATDPNLPGLLYVEAPKYE